MDGVVRFGFGFGFGSRIRKDSDSEKFRFVLPLVQTSLNPGAVALLFVWFLSHCNVLQELGDSRLPFLRHMAESIDSHGAEHVEIAFHRHSRWLSLLFKLK